jgi:hypothetical protein
LTNSRRLAGIEGDEQLDGEGRRSLASKMGWEGREKRDSLARHEHLAAKSPHAEDTPSLVCRIYIGRLGLTR